MVTHPGSTGDVCVGCYHLVVSMSPICCCCCCYMPQCLCRASWDTVIIVVRYEAIPMQMPLRVSSNSGSSSSVCWVIGEVLYGPGPSAEDHPPEQMLRHGVVCMETTQEQDRKSITPVVQCYWHQLAFPEQQGAMKLPSQLTSATVAAATALCGPNTAKDF